jgi:transposase
MATYRAFGPSSKQGGRKRTADVREVVNGIMYVLSTGCQWRYLPKDLPPKSTVYRYFDLWNYDGTLEAIHHTHYVKCREAEEREASPTAAIIDSQSVKSAEKGGRALTRMATMRAKPTTRAWFWRRPYAFDTSSTVHLRSSCQRAPDGLPRLFRNAHHLGHWTKAAYGGLSPDPAIRARGTYPHLLCSKAATEKVLYIPTSPSRRRGALSSALRATLRPVTSSDRTFRCVWPRGASRG